MHNSNGQTDTNQTVENPLDLNGPVHHIDDLEKIAPYAINAQVKVVMQRGDRKTAKKEPVDMPRLAKILREAGYRGYIVLEYEEEEDPREVCPKFLAEMRAAFT